MSAKIGDGLARSGSATTEGAGSGMAALACVGSVGTTGALDLRKYQAAAPRIAARKTNPAVMMNHLFNFGGETGAYSDGAGLGVPVAARGFVRNGFCAAAF